MFGGNNGGFGLDIGALLGNMMAKNGNGNGFGDGFGGGGLIAVLIILFFAFFRNGMFGNQGNCQGGNGGGSGVGYTVPFGASFTDAAVQRGFDNQGVMNKLNGIENGLCSLGYQQLAQINGINTNVAAGFAGVNNAVCNLGYQNAQLINGLENTVQNGFNASNVVALQNQNALQTQISNCCCEQRAATADLKYTIATEDCATRNLIQNSTRDIVEGQNASTRAILDYLCQEKIADLQSENQTLKFAASQQAQNNYLTNQLWQAAAYGAPYGNGWCGGNNRFACTC